MRRECLFCNSFKKNKDQDLIIFENVNAYSILNYKPSVYGHSLIIPKQHITNLKKNYLIPNYYKSLIIAPPACVIFQ